MTNNPILDRKDLELDENNIIRPFTPRLITGGKEPPDLPFGNWLEKLPESTNFLAREKMGKNKIDVSEYTLIKKLPRSSWLEIRLPHKSEQEGDEVLHWVHTETFSAQMELIDIIFQPEGVT